MVYLETTNDDKAIKIVKELSEVTGVRLFSNGFLVDLKTEGAHFMPKILDSIRNEKIQVSSVNLKKPTLDDVFIYFTGRGLRENNYDSLAH
jgi:ABC-2 type transport system ATP-binding protein